MSRKLEVKQEINPLYEEEIELNNYEDTNKEELANELVEIRKMFGQILENETQIQQDIRLIKRKRLKQNMPVQVVKKDSTQYYSSANRDFDLNKMNLPCSSLEDVRVLEKELADNLYFEIFFKNLLLEIDGYDLTSFLKKSLRSIVNDDVLLHFSWQGIGENIAIRSLKFIHILIDICGIKFNQSSKMLIKRGIQKYLSLIKEKTRRAVQSEKRESFWNNSSG